MSDTVVYRLVYDVQASAPPIWESVFVGTWLVAFGLVLWGVGKLDLWLWNPHRIGDFVEDPPPPPTPWGSQLEQARVFRVIGKLVVSFTIVFTAAIALLEYSSHEQLRRAIVRGDYTIVEGVVTEFVPGDRGGHRHESWSVHGGGQVHRYSYSYARGIPGFHQSAGPVREGLRVRITDVNGYIARLEVAP